MKNQAFDTKKIYIIWKNKKKYEWIMKTEFHLKKYFFLIFQVMNMNNENKIIYFWANNILKTQPLSRFQTPQLFYYYYYWKRKKKLQRNPLGYNIEMIT
jgi:hypothetical protein